MDKLGALPTLPALVSHGSMRSRFVLLVLPVAWMACFSASSGGGGADFDASSDATDFDTSMPMTDGPAPDTGMDVTVVDSAIDTSTSQEAAPAEAGPQDAALDAGPASQTVTVMGVGGPEAGVLVAFSTATGGPLGATMTDSTGTATTHAPPGGSVTVVLGMSLFTVLGVQPGQTVPLLDWSSYTMTAAQLTSVPALAPDSGVTDYAWYFGGGSPPQFPSIPFSRFMQTGQTPSFGIGTYGTTVGGALPNVIEAHNPGGVTLAWTTEKDVPIGGPLNDAGAVNVAPTTPWSTDTSITENLTTTSGDASVVVSALYFSEVADGVLLPLFSPYLVHGTFADFVQGDAEMGNVQQVIATRAPTPTVSSTMAFDVGPLATTPRPATATVTVPTPGQPTLAWTTSQGDFGAATGLVAITTWSATTDAGMTTGSWTIVAPGTTQTSITFPQLPPQAQSMVPPSGATGSLGAMYVMYGGTGVPAYPDLVGMSTRFTAVSGCVSGPLMPPLPHDGTSILMILAPGATGC